MARRLRIEPYDPDAVDGDGDGIVQEGTAWERPVGTRLIDEFGTEIRRGFMSTQRPPRMRVVDRDGNDVRYTPSYAVARERPVAQTPLGSIGAPSLAESGARPMPTLADQGLLTIGETGRNIDSIVNPQTVVGEDAPELPLPTPDQLRPADFPSADIKPSDVHTAILFGSLLNLMASDDRELYNALEDQWEFSGRDYLRYLIGIEEDYWGFRNLLTIADSGGELPTLTDNNGNVINPAELRWALGLSAANQITARGKIRELMKARVTRDLADHMTREDLSDPLLDELSVSLLDTLGPPRPYREYNMRLASDVARYGLPIESFDDGQVNLDDAKRASLVRWGLGGERPLWLDSSDTPEVFKTIYGAGVMIIKPDELPWDDDPVMIPVASMRVYPGDSPEVLQAKARYTALLEARDPINLVGDALNRENMVDAFSMFVSMTNERLAELAYNNVSSDIERRMISFFISKRLFDTDVQRFNAIGTILDSRDSSSNPFQFATAEQRLAAVASSGLLEPDELEHLKQLVGWDFTKQPGWDVLVKKAQRDQRPGSLLGLVEDHVPIVPDNRTKYPVRIVRISDAIAYRDENGNPIETTEVGQPNLTFSVLSSIGDERAQDAYRKLSEITRPLGEPARARTPEELIQTVRDVFEIVDSALPDGLPRDGFLEYGEILRRAEPYLRRDQPDMPDRIGPEKVELVTDRPAYFAMAKIANEFVSQWAMSSNGSEPLSYALQQIAQEMFGLDADSVVPMEDIYSWRAGRYGSTMDDMRENIAREIAERGQSMRLFMRSQYNNTQQLLRSMDIQSLPLTRSMSLPKDHPYLDELDLLDELQPGTNTDLDGLTAMLAMRPMSSFSNYLPATVLFRTSGREGITLFSRVPAQQILGTPFSGVGCLAEFETVVIGDLLPARIVRTDVVSQYDLFDPPSMNVTEEVQ